MGLVFFWVSVTPGVFRVSRREVDEVAPGAHVLGGLGLDWELHRRS